MRRTPTAVLALAALIVALPACDANPVDDPDGGGRTDAAGPSDAGVMDAASPPEAGSVLDSAPDAPDSMIVSPDAEVVSDSGADAGRPPECEPGTTRAVDCGSCGLASERCSAEALWERASECLGEGECAGGEVETRVGAMCSREARICDPGCFWREWTVRSPGGECEAGEMREVTTGCGTGSHRTERCSTLCAWEPDGGCLDACGATPRTAPWYAEEICIPAGPFIRGGGASASTTPQAEVFISAFYIDRFPVSNRRYRDCYDAGACPAPYVTEDWDDAAMLDHPVHQIDWYAAEAFCRWDASSSGPRRLPTEAEWEKAARGPAPRMQDYPWGPTRCGTVPLWGCGDTVPPELVNRTLSPIDAYPSAASYYGVDLMIGGVRSWVSDWWSFSYYSDPASTLPDPSGPASGFYRVMRGPDGTTSSDQLYRRSESLPAAYWPRVGIRCARSPR